MKKILSSILIFSTLITSYAPSVSYALPKPSLTGTESTAAFTTLKEENVLAKGHNYNISKEDEEKLKEMLLELSKDKKFLKQLEKNREKAFADPIWLKIVKFPFKTVWYLIKKAFDYTVGKKAAEFIEKVILPMGITALTGLFIYKKVPLAKTIIDFIISLASKTTNN